MEKDLDKKLYVDYLAGDKEAFKLLYNKYKSRIEYFIYNMVKDYQKAEDLAQETFIDIVEHKINDNFSFKYSLYMLAKSKAFNYINVENRRNEIADIYINNSSKAFEKDILEIIENEETKKEVLEAIELLEERYKNAVYLVNIEGLSYEETSKILGESLQNTKNLIHRGKKQLRKILLKQGFNNMNKTSKIILIIICVLLISGGAYGITAIVKRFTYNNVTMNPSYQSTLDDHTINNLWVGTLDLAWKELEARLGVNRIQIEGDDIPQIALDLNASDFSKEMLDKDDYKIEVEEILNGYKTNATLNKELNFPVSFDNFNDWFREYTFGDGEKYIKYFGINDASSDDMDKNIEVLFYEAEIGKGYTKNAEFAIKLKTKEGDEIILYRTDNAKNFDEYYEEIRKKAEQYDGDKEFLEDDELQIPYIQVNGTILYDELYGKEIKNSDGRCIYEVSQTVSFNLNESGCNLSSKATLVDATLGIHAPRYFYFRDTFVLFMKEAEAEQPYFALKVDNDDILEKIDEELYLGPVIYDYIAESHGEFDMSKIEEGEYKFYEDEKYEYYYPSHKSDYVYFLPSAYSGGLDMTAEEALKEGLVTIETFDRFGIEYIKKEK